MRAGRWFRPFSWWPEPPKAPSRERTNEHCHQGWNHRHGRPDLQGRFKGGRRARSSKSEPISPAPRRSTPPAATVMPGGIDPHTHLRNAFHGYLFLRRFRKRDPGGTRRRHHDGRRFRTPLARPVAVEALTMWDNKSNAAPTATIPSTWRSPVGRAGLRRDGDDRKEKGINTFQALHGLQGRADGGRRRDVFLLPACAALGAACRWSTPENGDVWRNCRRSCWRKAIAARSTCYSRTAEVEGEATNRAIIDRRHGRLSRLHRSYFVRTGA